MKYLEQVLILILLSRAPSASFHLFIQFLLSYSITKVCFVKDWVIWCDKNVPCQSWSSTLSFSLYKNDCQWVPSQYLCHIHLLSHCIFRRNFPLKCLRRLVFQFIFQKSWLNSPHVGFECGCAWYPKWNTYTNVILNLFPLIMLLIILFLYSFCQLKFCTCLKRKY